MDEKILYEKLENLVIEYGWQKFTNAVTKLCIRNLPKMCILGAPPKQDVEIKGE